MVALELVLLFNLLIGCRVAPSLGGVSERDHLEDKALPRDWGITREGKLQLGEPIDKEWQVVGRIADGDLVGNLLMWEYESAYLVNIAIPQRIEDDPPVSEALDVWMLAKEGKVFPLIKRPLSGPLGRAGGSNGVTANAIFYFKRLAPRHEIAAIAVRINKLLLLFPMPGK